MPRLSRLNTSSERERHAISEKTHWDEPAASRPSALGARKGSRLPNLVHGHKDGIPQALHLIGIAAHFVPIALSQDLLRGLFRVMHKEKTILNDIVCIAVKQRR